MEIELTVESNNGQEEESNVNVNEEQEQWEQTNFSTQKLKIVFTFLSVVMLQATASGLQDAFSKLCKSIRLTDTQKVLHECAAMHLLWRRGLLRINEGQLKLPDEYWIYYFMGLNNGAYVFLNFYPKF